MQALPPPGTNNPQSAFLINSDSEWSDISASPTCSYGSFGTLTVKMDSRSFVAQAGIVPYGAVLGCLIKVMHGWYGNGIPNTNVDTTYVMYGIVATPQGNGANRTWSITMPSIASIVAESGFTLRNPVDNGSSRYGDVISITGILSHGVSFDWTSPNQRHLSDFF